VAGEVLEEFTTPLARVATGDRIRATGPPVSCPALSQIFMCRRLRMS
jgi:hypothetical protein